MVTLQATISCDAWKYYRPDGKPLGSCLSKTTIPVAFDGVRTSLRNTMRGKKWWRDPDGSPHDPRYLCPSCRAVMIAKPEQAERPPE